ncbi:MAG: hypothetical protein K9N34_04595 [Candidatus Marinimicrobia bacterium]|nr:hypothetical protein [Candidatus Neomarinimicrobiota bacterium]MCF7839388.1 hypothetical protein [Candidatus Neomarinimicrobiota bacterium]
MRFVRWFFFFLITVGRMPGQALFVMPDFQAYGRHNITTMVQYQSDPEVTGIGIGINRLGDRGTTVFFQQSNEVRFLTLDFYKKFSAPWRLESVFSLSVSSPVRGYSFNNQVDLNVLDGTFSIIYPWHQFFYPKLSLKFSRKDLRADPQNDGSNTFEIGIFVNGGRKLPGVDFSVGRQITESGDWVEDAPVYYTIQLFYPVYWVAN